MASRDDTVQARCSTCNNFDLEEVLQGLQKHRIIMALNASLKTHKSIMAFTASLETRRHIMALKASLEEIRKRAVEGCRGCSICAFLSEPVGQEFNDQTLDIYFIQGLFSNTHPWRILMRLGVGNDIRGFFDVNILKDNYLLNEIVRPISGDTGSDKAIETARLWLETCKAEHTCQRTGIGNLPQRVVKIDTPNVVKIYVSQGERAEYACLSHCWGNQSSNPVLKTTQSSIKKFQGQIPWEDIPKTFRDAIYFCHKLGVQYLWIDSLCIIQDSVEDWRDQGSKMAEIYESAIFTIAATRAKNSSEGLFVRSDSKYVFRYMTVASLSRGRPPYTMHIREQLPHAINYPLLKRGWTFQESKLSCRTFSFENDELLWQCKNEIKCECGGNAHGYLACYYARKIDFNGLTTVEQCEAEWRGIVKDYTGTDLTFPKDIFPALQGLAKRFTPILGRYFAGLWEETLTASLSWECVRGLPHCANSCEWRAPTW